MEKKNYIIKRELSFYKETGIEDKVLVETPDLDYEAQYCGFAHQSKGNVRVLSFLKPLTGKECKLFEFHFSKFIESGANLKDEGYRLVCEGLSRLNFHNEENEVYHLTPGGVIGFLLWFQTRDCPIIIREYTTFGARYLVFNPSKKITEETSLERCYDLVVQFTKTKFLKSNIIPTVFSNDNFLSTVLASYFSYDKTSRELPANSHVTNRLLEYNNILYLPKDGYISVSKNEGAMIAQDPLKLNKPLFEDSSELFLRQSSFNQDLLPEHTEVQEPLSLIDQRIERVDALKDILTDGFIKFLIDLTQNNLEIMLALRTCLARILFAGDIGSKLQTGFWFYGPPRTGKSLIQKIISLFGNTEIISGGVSNFSTDTYKSASVIVFPDVLNFSSEQLQLLRRLLGRDPLSGERKYQQGSLTYVSKATTIITSNRYPGELKALNYEEYKDKLIFVPFTSPIPNDQIDPNLLAVAIKFRTELSIWALTIPSLFLDKQVRAEDYYQLIGRPEGANDDIFDEFLQSTLYTIDRDWKCPENLKIIQEAEYGGESQINFFTSKTCLINRPSLMNLYDEWCKNYLGEKHEVNGFYSRIKNTLNSSRYQLGVEDSRPRSANGSRNRCFLRIIYPTTEQKYMADKGLNNLKPVRPIINKPPINREELLEYALFGFNPDLGADLLKTNKDNDYKRFLEFKYSCDVHLRRLMNSTLKSSNSEPISWYDSTKVLNVDTVEDDNSVRVPELPSSEVTDEEVLQEDLMTFLKRKGLRKGKIPTKFLGRPNKTKKKLLIKDIKSILNRHKSYKDYLS